MTVANQLEILDLRHFSARQLRPLLEDEARLWKMRLRWNYESSIELLLQYLDSRILPGFVALDRGRVCGFTFCVYEGHKAVVGDVYAVGSDPVHSQQITERLLRHLLELLRHSPDVDRIESQMLLYETGSMSKSFLEEGFSIHPRLFMEFDQPESVPTSPPRTPRILPEYMELSRWTSTSYQPAAELIHAAYANHIDASINDQYRTLHGSLRFLHNIVRFPGCGVFEANSSWVLRDKRIDMLAGMLLCSRVAPDVAHITQLCVAAPYRRHGLGRILMEHCIENLSGDGFSAITLTVTEANALAVKLYESLGFTVHHRFDAMVKDASPTRRDSLGLLG
ncbi:GNAT family N-acetyltransferase [Granulicella sp. dw_53]|uniref:GNAT family N-acetyltransferase n=1 Tax=Granulicella sp. dw_53 TaxID=2719792 RepID=UPI001BD59D0C|nr:GNAT family N-acetyltransferase [Granulicella sp. dw_53]